MVGLLCPVVKTTAGRILTRDVVTSRRRDVVTGWPGRCSVRPARVGSGHTFP